MCIRPMWLFLCVFIWLKVIVVNGQDDHAKSDDNTYILGVMDAHMATLEGWEAFDVLIRYKTVGNGRRVEEEGLIKGPDAKSVIANQKGLVRLLVDLPGKRVLIINRIENETQMFDSLDQEIRKPSRIADDRRLLFDEARNIRLGQRVSGVPLQLVTLPPIEALLKEFGVPNLKAFGTAGSADSWHTETLIDTLRYNQQILKSVSHVGKDRYQTVLQDRKEIGALTRGFKIYVDWDVNDKVPVKFVSYSETPDGEFFSRPKTTENVRWARIDGHPVPVSSRRVFSKVRYLVDELRFYIEYDQSTDLHWFSFNQKLEDTLFSEEILNDPKRVDELMSEQVFQTSDR
ncbi:MAG: hypothetical protein Q8M16_08165 [Pirellulaceae bacterium]|nr:hypothetical protein [Pirellulaceae bacterium]